MSSNSGMAKYLFCRSKAFKKGVFKGRKLLLQRFYYKKCKRRLEMLLTRCGCRICEFLFLRG
ncbi:MAG: hypothetical protein QXN87_05465 [Candidatus Bathyarchaeia archaeon]